MHQLIPPANWQRRGSYRRRCARLVLSSQFIDWSCLDDLGCLGVLRSACCFSASPTSFTRFTAFTVLIGVTNFTNYVLSNIADISLGVIPGEVDEGHHLSLTRRDLVTARYRTFSS